MLQNWLALIVTRSNKWQRTHLISQVISTGTHFHALYSMIGTPDLKFLGTFSKHKRDLFCEIGWMCIHQNRPLVATAVGPSFGVFCTTGVIRKTLSTVYKLPLCYKCSQHRVPFRLFWLKLVLEMTGNFRCYHEKRLLVFSSHYSL